MLQTVVLQQNVDTQPITLKFNDSPSNANPNSDVDSKIQTPVNDENLDSKSDPENQPITTKFDDPSSNLIPIPNVDSQTQAAVNEFLRKHNESTDAEIRTDARRDLRSFVQRHEIEIRTLLVVVNFASEINNSELLDVFCEIVADAIKDKTVEEVREIFNITNDFTPGEEQAIHDEHPWAFED